ncbi:MAG: DUF998 domain-containing protein [Solirubrobacteraceae bacterium]
MAPVFLAVAWSEGASRDGDRQVRDPISALALGERGPCQTANFLGAGTLICAFATGARRAAPTDGVGVAWRPIAAAGGGLIAAGIFPTNPVGAAPGPTAAGTAHQLAAVPVMLGLPAAILVHGTRPHRHGQQLWAGYSVLSGLASITAFVLSAAGFARGARRSRESRGRLALPSQGMTAKEKLRERVEALSEKEAAKALRLVDQHSDPLGERLDHAPVEDEQISPEEQAAVQEAREGLAAGGALISHEQIKRELGIA